MNTTLDARPCSDLTIQEVAARLRVGLRTLEGWLSSDVVRAPDDRRFQFHVRRGRKRLWSAKAVEALRAAIERESEPGGVLAVSKSKSAMASGTSSARFVPQDVQSAFAEVLNFPLRPRTTMPPGTASARSRSRPERRPPGKTPEVIPLS